MIAAWKYELVYSFKDLFYNALKTANQKHLQQHESNW